VQKRLFAGPALLQRRNTAALSKLHALCAGRPEAMAEVMAKVRRLQLTCAFFLSFFLSFLSFFFALSSHAWVNRHDMVVCCSFSLC
jgi:hypothetical protein